MPRRLTVRITNKPAQHDSRPSRGCLWERDRSRRRSQVELGAGPAVTAEVTGDLVTLHGVVERAYQKSCAEATVRHVPGVTGVRIEVAVRAAQEFSRLNLPPNLDWRFGAE